MSTAPVTNAQNPQQNPPKTNIQRLSSLFTGNSASGSGPTPMELGSTTPTGSKRGRIEDDPANPVFTKLDLFSLLDEQEVNYQKNTEVSIAKALDTFGTEFRSVAKADTKELLGKYHDKLDNRFQAVDVTQTQPLPSPMMSTKIQTSFQDNIGLGERTSSSSKNPRRKPGARECMQISRRFGIGMISPNYMEILLVSSKWRVIIFRRGLKLGYTSVQDQQYTNRNLYFHRIIAREEK